MGRPALHKTGAMPASERQARWRASVKKRKAAEPALLKLQAKRERRAQRERDLAEATLAAGEALGSGTRYGVLLVDPPSGWLAWSWKRIDSGPQNHHPTMGA